MKYDKSKIMKKAWVMFNNDDFDTSYYEYVVAEVYGQKTFADCLKESWAKEKEYQEQKAKEAAEAPKSEEAKAWDWACRKLNVIELQNIDAVDKVYYVDEMAKEMWSANVWAQAIKAVKLHIELFAA
ncbi:anti-CRISPR protein AcrIIA3 [Streptococcus halichoeri]|uniref:anti-CRISPR protein AcrIIA3 n=1 Tax=Streptococcus halichoeri TaxID=254785 RepID=UPI0013581F18|nr:anti-CRISPR protein AcrIIA3 [Streptococcus halichoeri]